jgi:hypothetical protein
MDGWTATEGTYHACCYTGAEEGSWMYAALFSRHVSPASVEVGLDEDVVVTLAVHRSTPNDRLTLTAASSVLILEAPFSRALPIWPLLEVGAVVVHWSFGGGSHINADPFDSSIFRHIVVRRGVVAALGRLDFVFVQLDGETAPRRVKRCDLRKVVAQRMGTAGAAVRRKKLITKLFVDQLSAAGGGRAGNDGPTSNSIKFVPNSAGIGHTNHEMALDLEDINRQAERKIQ